MINFIDNSRNTSSCSKQILIYIFIHVELRVKSNHKLLLFFFFNNFRLIPLYHIHSKSCKKKMYFHQTVERVYLHSRTGGWKDTILDWSTIVLRLGFQTQLTRLVLNKYYTVYSKFSILLSLQIKTLNATCTITTVSKNGYY